MLMDEEIKKIKNKLQRGHALTVKESWDSYKYIEALEQQPNRCDSCIHSEEQDGSNCYECVKGMADNFETQSCEDCISRDEAIKETKALFLRNFDSEYVVEMLKTLPSVTPKARWIPVSERLPEANGRYVVTRGLNACGALWNRVYIVNYSDLMGLKSERIWWDGNVGKSDFKRIDDVIAWMPLPEPYKAESEDEE